MSPIMDAALAEPDEPFEDAWRRLRDAGFTDGLPVVPPTAERVRSLCEPARLDPARALGKHPPPLTQVTVSDVAINAVMAGCEASHLPVLVAAVEAATEPHLNLSGILTGTGGAAIALLVNGPVGTRLGISGGADCLSGSSRANACIGRAFCLLLRNLGCAKPEAIARATMGQPARLSLCFAENDARSPWPALHTLRGLAAEESAVTLFGISGTVAVGFAPDASAEEMLQTIARSMTIAGHVGDGGLIGGGEPLVVLAPETATALAAEGFDRAGVQRELWRRARLRLRDLAAAVRGRIEQARRQQGREDADAPLAVSQRSADIALAVAGGAGTMTNILPGWSGGTRSVTHRIDDFERGA